MAAIDLAREYISKINGDSGAAVAGLFSEEGSISDPMGNTHRGREAIAAFAESAPPNTIAQISEREIGEDQVILRGTVTTGSQSPAETEWIFEVDNEVIQHLTIHLLNA